jgi:hypothetical protein
MSFPEQTHMDEFFRNVPRIIEESAKNPLALVALIILALSFLGLFYFRDASERTRIVIFLFMGFGALMLVAILFSQSPIYGPQPAPFAPAQLPVQSPVYSPPPAPIAPAQLPRQPQIATVCVDPSGMVCGTLVSLGPRGVACTCFTPFGPVLGVSQ